MLTESRYDHVVIVYFLFHENSWFQNFVQNRYFDIIYTAGDELIRMGGISSGGHVTIPIRSLLFSLPPQAFC